ncbi:MAG: YlxM family DNA-binding protein [Spirochaetales bacterium]
MNLEKSLEVSLLNDFYGKLLTDKQEAMLVDYFDNNMSLAEIAENNGVTRQAIRDSLVKSQKLLYEFEEKLGFMKKNLGLKAKLTEILLNDTLTLKECKQKLKALLDEWED